MTKGLDSDYDKRNIFVMICDIDIRNGSPGHVGNRATFEMKTSTSTIIIIIIIIINRQYI